MSPPRRDRIETARLVLRRPRPEDATRVFARYSSDPEVTRLMGWPTHTNIHQTIAFVDFAHSVWSKDPAGPLLIECRETGKLLGSTGLDFETPYRAATGYVLARDAWGKGYATEALQAMVALAAECNVARLYAICHFSHAASAHVLEKGGFAREALLRKFLVFPNSGDPYPADVLLYAHLFR